MMHRLQRIKGCGGKTLVTIVGRRQSGAMNYIAVIRRLASTCTPAHTLNCMCTLLRAVREKEQGSSPETSGSRLDEAHLSLVPPLVAADAPSHSSSSTPCEATAHPVTDSLLSSSRHLVASLSVILSLSLPAALLRLEAADLPARPT